MQAAQVIAHQAVALLATQAVRIAVHQIVAVQEIIQAHQEVIRAVQTTARQIVILLHIMQLRAVLDLQLQIMHVSLLEGHMSGVVRA